MGFGQTGSETMDAGAVFGAQREMGPTAPCFTKMRRSTMGKSRLMGVRPWVWTADVMIFRHSEGAG